MNELTHTSTSTLTKPIKFVPYQTRHWDNKQRNNIPCFCHLWMQTINVAQCLCYSHTISLLQGPSPLLKHSTPTKPFTIHLPPTPTPIRTLLVDCCNLTNKRLWFGYVEHTDKKLIANVHTQVWYGSEVKWLVNIYFSFFFVNNGFHYERKKHHHD